MASGSDNSLDQQVDPSSIIENEKTYIPVCWDESTLKQDSNGCFSSSFQLEEFFHNSGSDFVNQGWRLFGGTFKDILLWCLITCTKASKGK